MVTSSIINLLSSSHDPCKTTTILLECGNIESIINVSCEFLFLLPFSYLGFKIYRRTLNIKRKHSLTEVAFCFTTMVRSAIFTFYYLILNSGFSTKSFAYNLYMLSFHFVFISQCLYFLEIATVIYFIDSKFQKLLYYPAICLKYFSIFILVFKLILILIQKDVAILNKIYAGLMPVVNALHYVVHALTIIVLSIAFVLSKFSALFFPKALTNILKYAIFIYSLALFINIISYYVYSSKHYNYVLAYRNNTGIQILKYLIRFCVFDLINISLLVIVWILAIPDYIQEQAQEPIDMTFDDLNI